MTNSTDLSTYELHEPIGENNIPLARALLRNSKAFTTQIIEKLREESGGKLDRESIIRGRLDNAITGYVSYISGIHVKKDEDNAEKDVVERLNELATQIRSPEKSPERQPYPQMRQHSSRPADTVVEPLGHAAGRWLIELINTAAEGADKKIKGLKSTVIQDRER